MNPATSDALLLLQRMEEENHPSSMMVDQLLMLALVRAVLGVAGELEQIVRKP